MSAIIKPITSDGGFTTSGNIIVGDTGARIVISSDSLEYQGASPAPTISGFQSATFPGDVTSSNISLISGYIKGGIPTEVEDGINDIYTGYTTTMDVFGFPFSQLTRGQLTISGNITPADAIGTWYYQSTSTNTFEIFTDNTYSTPVDSTSWAAYTGGGNVTITKLAPPANVVIDSAGFLTKFDNTGNLTFPDNTTTSGSTIIVHGNYDMQSDGNTTIKTSAFAGHKEWKFDNTGNLTLPGNTFSVNYANGTQVSIGGGGGSYGNSDVVTLLGSFGSNTISTTGNISGGNVLSSGYGRFTGSFLESQASTAGMYLGYAGGTSRIMFGTGNTLQTFEIDNDGGDLRFYQPGSTKATLTSTGNLTIVGNISATNIGNISSINRDGNGSNILLGNGVFSSQGSLRTLLVADTLVNTNSGSPLQLTSSMYRILINAGTASGYTFTLPDTNTCYIGQSFVLSSAQAVTQNYSYTIALFGGGSSGQSWTAGTNIVATCVAQRGGSAEVTTNWKYSYQGSVAVTGTGAQVMSISPSLNGPTLIGNINASGGALNMCQTAELFATWSYAVNNSTTAVPTAVATGGVFTIPSTAGLSMGQPVTITGTLGGTGTISGYTTGTTYYIIGSVTVGGATSITLSASRNSSTAVTTTAGTLSGLTMTFGAAVGVYSYTTGTIVNITGTIGANFDVNINNIFASGYAYNVTLVINQGATPYIPANVYLGQFNGYAGTAQTIRWAGGVTPTGTANAKDVITLSWLPSSGYAASLMLGQLVSFS